MSINEVSIRKVSGGYILEWKSGEEQIEDLLEDVFERLLLHFEGLAPSFFQDSYGKVTIQRGNGPSFSANQIAP